MATRKLYRSNSRWLAGVLGGLAEYTGHDPLLYRLAFIVVLVATGFMPGVLVYAIAWFLIPEDTGVHYEM